LFGKKVKKKMHCDLRLRAKSGSNTTRSAIRARKIAPRGANRKSESGSEARRTALNTSADASPSRKSTAQVLHDFFIAAGLPPEAAKRGTRGW
jgi:hypothetical protein